MTVSRMMAVVANPRETAWLIPSVHRLVETAPSTQVRQPAAAEPTSSLRRPLRSARATSATDPSTPARTAARVKPWLASLEPNWEAAKVMVWVMTVPR